MLARTIAPHTALGFSLLGARAVPLASADDTGAAWEALELTLSDGARSPLHTLSHDKLFYVAEGVVTVVLGESETALLAGGHALVPAGTPHAYRNSSGEPARLLVMTTGGEQVAFLRGMSALTAGGPPEQEALAAHTAAHGVRLLASAGA